MYNKSIKTYMFHSALYFLHTDGKYARVTRFHLSRLFKECMFKKE